MALRVPISWLKDFVDAAETPVALAERLTAAGLEVESVTALGADWDRERIRVGHVIAVAPHPNADRLCLATVDYGGAAPVTVVTGAPNVVRYVKDGLPQHGLKAPFAMNGAELIDGHSDEPKRIKLKPTKIRGVQSEGMVCSEKELGLSEEHEGILLLPDDAPVGAPLVDYLGDAVLEFDIKGRFSHLQSIYGVARETAALYGRPLRDWVWKLGGGGTAAADTAFVTLEIEAPDFCPRYTALLIERVKIGPSPFHAQQRIKRAGMRPINAVVDAANYVMLELGQPLHAFDYAKLRPPMNGATPLIRVRRALEGEHMRTLDGVERTLDPNILLITDGGGPVAIAGVMGGLESEVTDATTTVLLESANFEFLQTRRASQQLKLRTEAADRFGQDLDPEACLAAARRCAHLIAEWCGGTVRPEAGDLFKLRPRREPISLRADFVRSILGVEIPQTEIARILTSLEFTVQGSEPMRVSPPSHRKDVSLPADLAEEVGRVHGYDRMAPTLIRGELPVQRRNAALDGAELVRDLLTGCGLDEIITYSIVSLADEGKLVPAGAAPDPADYVTVQNPLDAERAHLRRSLLPGALNTARANLRFGPRVAVFELGSVFHVRPGEPLPAEPRRVSALLTGPREPQSWLAGAGSGPFEFYDAKGVAEALLDGLDVEDVGWERSAGPAFHPGRSARLMLRGRELGSVGELHPRVSAAFGLPQQSVCALEFDLDLLLEGWNEQRRLQPISSLPPIYEDLAFIVDESVPAERVQALILETGRPLLRGVALFDLYRGDQIGAAKKSLAYALTYQAGDRTLTDAEVAKVREKIVRRVTQELGAVLRSG